MKQNRAIYASSIETKPFTDWECYVCGHHNHNIKFNPNDYTCKGCYLAFNFDNLVKLFSPSQTFAVTKAFGLSSMYNRKNCFNG